jgi:hypothetical protein
MMVTTTSRATARPSMWDPMPKVTPPFCHQVQVCVTGSTKALVCSWPGRIDRPSAARALSLPTWSSTRLIHWTAVPTASTSEARMAAMPM